MPVTRKCENVLCGKEFQAKQSDVDRGWARFCSKACAAKSKKSDPMKKPADPVNHDRNELASMFMHGILSRENSVYVSVDDVAKESFEAADAFLRKCNAKADE